MLEKVLDYAKYVLIGAVFVEAWRPVCWVIGKLGGWC